MDDDYEEINEFFDNNAYEDETVGEKDQLNNLLEKENDQVKKKVTKIRRQPKLDEMTLMGPNGIVALRESFKSFKPDPKADPYDNLDVMLKKYEHWTHCMFPKLKFEDVVNRLEHLGEKRAVKVYMMKSRLGMPLTDEDFGKTRRAEGEEIIETENNEDDIAGVSRRCDSDDDENYYDPLQLANSGGKSRENEVVVTSTLPTTLTPGTNFSPDVEEDMIESANELRKMAMEAERNRQDEEELAMADEIMADFDMY